MHNRKSVAVTTSADSAAVATADMRSYLRVSGTDSDTLIADHVAAATEAIKQYLRRGLLTETLTLTMDRFATGDPNAWVRGLGGGVHDGSLTHYRGDHAAIDLPFSPVQTINSVTTYNADNTAAVFAAASYKAGDDKIYLNDGYSWPTSLRDHDAVSISYDVGFGSGSIPAPIVEAIKEFVAAKFDGCGNGEILGRLRGNLAPWQRVDSLAWL